MKPIETVHQMVALRVRAIREAIGMDQATMAKQLGLSRTAYVNIEAGKQRLHLGQVETMARTLNTTPKHIMRGIWT